jgi:DNA-binding HxlR family transcriptional regulator
MPLQRVGAPLDAFSRPPPKSVLQILAFFSRHHEGQSNEIAAATGLSLRIVSKRLNELVRAEILDVVQTKTFPSVPRYRMLTSHVDIARLASSLLSEMKNRRSIASQPVLVQNARRKVGSDSDEFR